jgi:galactose-1-phosphate uridylyltransferase
MRIGEPGFREAADFATRAPGWLVASNSDIAWAGASVLSHHHIQVFKQLNLPIEQAKVQTTTQVEKAMVSLLNWYTPVLRIIGPSESVLQTTSSITTKWKSIVKGKTTCNYLMRSAGADQLCIHLLLRHSDYRTPKSLQHIKAEGVGIIEMAGEIIVPPISGKDRNENKAWFQKHGPMVVEGIIDGNAPKAGDFMPPDFLQLVL